MEKYIYNILDKDLIPAATVEGSRHVINNFGSLKIYNSADILVAVVAREFTVKICKNLK